MSDEMNFLDHFAELRKRLIRAMIGLGVMFLLTINFAPDIFAWLMIPLCKAFDNQACNLHEISVAEGFITYLKTAFVSSIFLSAPWIFFQVWGFISPGLHQHEKKYVIPFVGSATLMFVGGALFGYFLVFPLAFEFFISVAEPNILKMHSMAAYFSITSTLLFAFGILFEIPVLVVLLNILGVVSAAELWRTWRYAIVAIFAVSAILTPADPFTMILLGIPLSILYVSSLGICSLLEHLKKKKAKESEGRETDAGEKPKESTGTIVLEDEVEEITKPEAVDEATVLDDSEDDK